MVNNSQLTPTQKIKALREATNCTQKDLAAILGCARPTISRIENGDWDYSDADIAVAKKFFGVEKAPFTIKELKDFKERLYRWKDLIRNRQLDEARKNKNELMIITKLPFEQDLNTLYKMFEIRLVLAEANVALAEELLLSEKSLIEEATEENQHHFNYNMGSLYVFKGDFKIALQYYLKARSLEISVLEEDVFLNFNLAMCYSMLGKYTLAIGTIEEVYDLIDLNKGSRMQTYVNSLLAINYVFVGQATRAKRILDKALSVALSNTNKMYIGAALHNYGCACLELKNYQGAINYFDRVFEYHEIGDKFYMENMYWKVYCLIQLKEVPKAKMLLSETKPLTEGNEYYTLIFESLSHLLTINDDASIDFIEQKTIPYLIEKYEYYRALNYCKMLENKFTIWINNGYKKRLAELVAIIRKITDEITFGEEVIFDEERICGHHIDANDGN